MLGNQGVSDPQGVLAYHGKKGSPGVLVSSFSSLISSSSSLLVIHHLAIILSILHLPITIRLIQIYLHRHPVSSPAPLALLIALFSPIYLIPYFIVHTFSITHLLPRLTRLRRLRRVVSIFILSPPPHYFLNGTPQITSTHPTFFPFPLLFPSISHLSYLHHHQPISSPAPFARGISIIIINLSLPSS